MAYTTSLQISRSKQSTGYVIDSEKDRLSSRLGTLLSHAAGASDCHAPTLMIKNFELKYKGDKE